MMLDVITKLQPNKLTTSQILSEMCEQKIELNEHNINVLFMNYFSDYTIYYTGFKNHPVVKIIHSSSDNIKYMIDGLFSKPHTLKSQQEHLFHSFEALLREEVVARKSHKTLYKHLLDVYLKANNVKNKKSNKLVNDIISNSLYFNYSLKITEEQKYEFISNILSKSLEKDINYIYDRFVKKISVRDAFYFLKYSINQGYISSLKLCELANALLGPRTNNLSNRTLLFKILEFNDLSQHIKSNYSLSQKDKLKSMIEKSDGSEFAYKKFAYYKNVKKIDDDFKDLLDDKLINGVYQISYNPVAKLIKAIKELGIDKKKVATYIMNLSSNDKRYEKDLERFLVSFPELEHLVNYV